MVGVLVAAMFFVAFMASALAWTSTRSFCSDFCHEMTPDIASYRRSVHANVSCYGCHMRAGTNPAGFVFQKAKKLGELYLHFTGKYEYPLNHGSHIMYAGKVDQTECVQCHSPATREYTIRAGIIMNHAVHREKRIGCPICHNRVAHPGIAAYQDMTAMEGCFRCHTQEQAAPAEQAGAEGTHGAPASTPTEGEKAHDGAMAHVGATGGADWIAQGREELAQRQLAFTAPGACDKCHPKGFELMPAGHARKGWLPEAHNASYKAVVAVKAEGSVDPDELAKPVERHAPGDKKPCEVCHPQRFCDDCHGIEMPHPADIKETHKEKVANREVCRRCHGGDDFCNRCHHGNVPTLRGWLAPAGHPAQTTKTGADPCFKCHDPRFCNTCHIRGKADRRYL